MDSSVVFNIVTTAIAVVAVVTSIVFSARQARTAKHANHISVLVDLLREFRSAEFHEQHDYVCHRLGAEHDPAGGVRGLPAEAKAAFCSVVYYYQSFANLAVFGLLDQTLLVTVLRTRIVSVWKAVRPFVERERLLRGEAAREPICRPSRNWPGWRRTCPRSTSASRWRRPGDACPAGG
ncbi:DUF4760 domain-containing protein [Streptomyces massasporeus]|uniref:DUF4760 domain-containing protein n=1 Tax=Streptomyces massasporeus TaxID=67324 RepID=UPI0036603A2D